MRANTYQTQPKTPKRISTPNPDPRVSHALRSVDVGFQVTPLGDHALTVALPTDRNHAVIIESRTAQVGCRELRSLFACGYISDDPLSADIMEDLLERNADYHIGAWQLSKDEDSYMAILSASIPADTSAIDLVRTAYALAAAADDVEEILTGRDQF